jgi:hypothetical protein
MVNPSRRVEMAERRIANATRRSASHTKALRLVVNRLAGVAGATRGMSDICLAIYPTRNFDGLLE